MNQFADGIGRTVRTGRLEPTLPARGSRRWRSTRRRSGAAGALAAGLAWMLAGDASAQTGDEMIRIFTDRVDVEVVEVEVVVTDADGRPVTDLTRDDFEVFEDDRPVELTNFLAVVDRRPVAAGDGAEPSSAAAALPPEQRLNLVLFVDNLSTAPLERNRVLELLRDRLPQVVAGGDRLMVVAYDRALRVEQRFCQDLDLVFAALDRVEKNVGGASLIAEKQRALRALLRAPDAPSPEELAQVETKDQYSQRDEAHNVLRTIHTYAEQTAGRTELMLHALGSFADSLAALPGRNVVMLVSGGIDLRPGEELFELWVERFGLNLGPELGVTSALSEAQRYDQNDNLNRVLKALRSSQTVLYGLGVGGDGMAGLAAAEIGAGGERAITSIRARDPLETLKSLAGESGGLALPARTKSVPVLDRMAEALASYYSLGYTRPPPEPGSEHSIEVRVAGRRDLRLRYRSTYRVKGVAEQADDRVMAALLHDVTDNPLGVRLELGNARREKRDRFLVPIVVRIPFANLLLVPAREEHAASLVLVIAVQDAEGRLSPLRRVEVPVRIANDRLLGAMAEDFSYQAQLEVRAGEQKLAVAVVDRLAAVTSTVNLTVPLG